jgi:ribonuclease D
MSRKPVRSVADLDRVRGLPRPVEEAEGQRIVEATQRGLAVPAGQRPVPVSTEESAGERFATDALWAAVQAYCHGKSIDPALVASRQDMARIIRGEEGGRLFTGWRAELIGHKLTQLRSGHGDVRLTWRDGVLRSD